MYRKPILCIGILVLFLSTSCVITFAGSGYDLVVGPAPGNASPNGGVSGGYNLVANPGPGDIVEAGGADGNETFWELPLWIQISIMSGLLTGFLAALVGILKFGPLVLGKLKNLLENQIRAKIYDSVKNNPGSTMADITKREGLNIGTVRYHINQLQASHKITFIRSNKFLRIFQNSNTYSDREKIIISTMNRSSARAIVMYLDGHPGSNNTQIAENLKISDSGTHVQLKKLVKEGIIRSSLEGKSLRYFLMDDVKEHILKQGSRKVV